MCYGEEKVYDRKENKSEIAIFDLGTSIIGVPDHHHKVIRDNWNKQIPEEAHFECNDKFVKITGVCYSNLPCTTFHDKLDPISFNFGDITFQIEPEGYLVQNMKICVFGVALHPKQ